MDSETKYKATIVKRESSVSPPGWDHSSESEQPLDYSLASPEATDKRAVQRVPSEPYSPEKKVLDSNSDSEQSWVPRHDVVAPLPLRLDPRISTRLLLSRLNGLAALPLSNPAVTTAPHIDAQYFQYQQALLQQISSNTQRLSSRSPTFPSGGILSTKPSQRQSSEIQELSEQSDNSSQCHSDSSCHVDSNGGSVLTGIDSCDSASVTSQTSTRSSRKRGKAFPDELKDSAYWERRRRNNAAAKRSRDARRAKEDETAIRAAFLEQENFQLRIETNSLRQEIERMRSLIAQIPAVHT